MWSEARAHLREAGESYAEHMRFAVGVGVMLMAAGLACIIHGVFPGFCTRTASRTIDGLKGLFVERSELASVLREASGALTFVGLIALTVPAWSLLLVAPGYPVPLLTALLAMAIPIAYLCSNPQLEPVD
ncbi:MAG: DUF6356 family protein [Sphingomicrobium sp.]